MDLFLNVLGCVGVLLVLGLAGVGVSSLITMANGDNGRHDIQKQAGRAEQQIIDLGHQAQLAILHEAMQRAYGNPTPPAGTRPDSPADHS